MTLHEKFVAGCNIVTNLGYRWTIFLNEQELFTISGREKMDYMEYITAEKVFARGMLPASKRRGKQLIYRVVKSHKKVKSDDLERKAMDHQSKKYEPKKNVQK